MKVSRASVSVASNIAEGKGHNKRGDFNRFLHIAYGSGAELETQVEIAKRLNWLPASHFTRLDTLLLETMKMLNVFMTKISSGPTNFH